MKTLLTTTAILLAATAARADDSTFAPHVNVGGEILGGDAMISGGVRTHLGVDRSFGTGRVQPSFGIGATFGLASLSIEDPRALDGSVSIGHFDYGPEVQIGLRWVDGGHVDTRVFGSLAYLRTDLDDRLMLDAIEGVGGTRGFRASLGANWADRIGRVVGRAVSGEGDGPNDASSLLLFLLPQQVEVTFERSAGSDRYGVTFSYGI